MSFLGPLGLPGKYFVSHVHAGSPQVPLVLHYYRLCNIMRFYNYKIIIIIVIMLYKTFLDGEGPGRIPNMKPRTEKI
jgi:hypothetical protein